MAVDEESRLGLYEAVKQVIGVDHATTFMEHLPYGGWQRLADKDDIARLETATKNDIARLETATKNDIGRLKNDIRRLEDNFARLDLRLDGYHKEIRDLHRSLFFSLLAAQATFAGIIGGVIIAVG